MCLLCRSAEDPALFVSKLRTKLGNDGLSILPERRDALLNICKEIEEKIPAVNCCWRLCMEFEDTKGGVLDKKYKEFETCVLQKDDWKQVEEKLRQFLLEYDSAKSDGLRSSRLLGVKCSGLTTGISSSLVTVERKLVTAVYSYPRARYSELKRQPVYDPYTPHSKKLYVLDKSNGSNRLLQFFSDIDDRLMLLKEFYESRMRVYLLFCVGSIPVSVQKCLQLCEELEKAYIFRRIPLIDGYDPYIGRCERVGEYVLNMKTVDWDKIRKFLWEIIFDWRRELGFQGITVEDLDGEQHIIYNNMYHRYGNMDYLVSSVVDTTGLSKEDFVFVYGKSLIFPWENLYIPDGANIKLLPLKKELANQSIVVEDLDGQQYIINTNWVMYNDDVDYLVRQVARTTGISKRRFVLVYSEKLIVPGQYFYIPNGAKIQLLPVKKNQNPPTDLTTYVRGICNGIYGQIHRLLSNFPKAFEDTTRLLSEKDFVRISQLIGKGWGMLGIELGLTKVKLQQIKEDKQNAVSRIFEMLNQWGQTRKNGATAGQLLSAVMKSGVSCEFENLKRALLIGL